MHSPAHPCESNGAEREAGAHLSAPGPFGLPKPPPARRAPPLRMGREGASVCRHRCEARGMRLREGGTLAAGRTARAVQCRSRLSPRGSSTTRRSKHPPRGHRPPQAHSVTSGHTVGGHTGAGRAGGQRPRMQLSTLHCTGQLPLHPHTCTPTRTHAHAHTRARESSPRII